MRRIERIPKIIKFFKKNKKAFNEINNIKKGNYHQMFLDNYEELFVIWYEYPDLRFCQLLINESIVPENNNWNKEETVWLIDNKYFKPEQLLLWGTRGLDAAEKYKHWMDDKPKYGIELSSIETWLYPKAQLMDDNEIYAWRWSKWRKQEPPTTYKFIEDLETSHIQAILDTQPQISDYYRKIFENVLSERNEQKTTEEIF